MGLLLGRNHRASYRVCYGDEARKPRALKPGMQGLRDVPKSRAEQTEWLSMDELTGLPKTFKYKLRPTLSQERALACVVGRCRELYNAALEERREAWQKCCVRITAASQSAQLPAI